MPIEHFDDEVFREARRRRAYGMKKSAPVTQAQEDANASAWQAQNTGWYDRLDVLFWLKGQWLI